MNYGHLFAHSLVKYQCGKPSNFFSFYHIEFGKGWIHLPFVSLQAFMVGVTPVKVFRIIALCRTMCLFQWFRWTCSLQTNSITLTMEAAHSSKMVEENYDPTQCNDPEVYHCFYTSVTRVTFCKQVGWIFVSIVKSECINGNVRKYKCHYMNYYQLLKTRGPEWRELCHLYVSNVQRLIY